MNRTMCGAALGVMISATTAFAGIVTAENPPAKPSRGDVHLADFKGFKLEFRWTGRWVWANGRSDNTSSYEWLQNPSARYCYNDGCQMVTHSINGTTDTFTTADGGYFEFTSREGGREMAASYWRGGRRASAGSPPDATATFYSDTAKPAPPPPDASATADPIRPATPSTNRTPDMTAKASAPVTAPTGSPTQPAAPPSVTPATDTAPAPAEESARRDPLRLSEPELRARLRDYTPPPHVRQRIRSLTRFVKISCLVPIELLVDETGAVAQATPQPSPCPPNVALLYAEATRHWRFEPTRSPDGSAIPVIGIVHIPFPPPEKDAPDGARPLPRR